MVGPNTQLIDAQVDETITTAANVLHLSALSRNHLLEFSAELKVGAANQIEERHAGTQAPGSGHKEAASAFLLPKLECHASNLHYDLRSLIKLFAPPSLQTNLSWPTNVDWNQKSAAASSLEWARLEGEPQIEWLAKSIERAFWLNLNSLNYAPTNNATEQRVIMPTDALDHNQKHEDEKENSEADNDDQGQPGQLLVAQRLAGHQQVEPALKDSQPEANWPKLIEQQLIRPHRLASDALGDEGEGSWRSATRSQLASSNSAAAAAAASAELARKKLIALEVYRKYCAGGRTSSQISPTTSE